MPKTWVIEVLLKTYHVQHGEREEWRPYRGHDGKPYVWSTEREARAMLDLCFSDDKFKDRVRVMGYEAR